MSTLSPEPAAIVLDRELDTELVREIVLNQLGATVDDYLYAQRWFGDKDRPILEVVLGDVAVEAVASGWFVLATAIVGFEDFSEASDYLVLAAVVPDPGTWTDDSLARITTPAATWQVVDIAAAPAFPAWWLSHFAAEATLAGVHGRYRWRRLPGFAAAAREAGPGTLVLGGMGQSNTTVRYGEAMFGKIFRRLREGINPDEEISRFLAERTSFRQLPIPYGTATYQADGGGIYPVGVLFDFIPSVGEGWGWTQDFLATVPLASYAAAARRLGERTARLHLALSSVETEPDFAPEPVTEADIAYWEHTTAAGVRAICEDLRIRRRDLSPRLQSLVMVMLDNKAELLDRVAGFRALTGTMKTRIHGDYHLGQLLRTPDDDWVLLDFEGEPARPIEQRRAKTSPMKDVADMLHSFTYARGMAARSAAADHARLATWEREARAAFLAGYRGEVASSPVALVPAGEAEFERAIAAWALAKSLYQVRYELGNRPDWLDVSLTPLIPRQDPPGR
ncbi:MAG: phosphotransferase [Chloroflexota bacterium]|nr:phosphotransferase [Chloroflexota bacterium]MDQ3695998.1 phosphotransferase [Chloroflexota bacterium]